MKLAVIGVGLIGGSFALALKKARAVSHVVGVGRGAAMLIFARYAGEWTIAEQSRNPGAIRFWRRVVSEFTNDKFREKRGQGEIAHIFTSAGPAGVLGR